MERYLEIIGQSNIDLLLAVIEEVLDELFLNRFTDAIILREACEKNSCKEAVDPFIAELKNGRTISPCLSYSLFSRKFFSSSVENFSGGEPLYELNKPLFVLDINKSDSEDN